MSKRNQIKYKNHWMILLWKYISLKATFGTKETVVVPLTDKNYDIQKKKTNRGYYLSTMGKAFYLDIWHLANVKFSDPPTSVPGEHFSRCSQLPSFRQFRAPNKKYSTSQCQDNIKIYIFIYFVTLFRFLKAFIFIIMYIYFLLRFELNRLPFQNISSEWKCNNQKHINIYMIMSIKFLIRNLFINLVAKFCFQKKTVFLNGILKFLFHFIDGN